MTTVGRRDLMTWPRAACRTPGTGTASWRWPRSAGVGRQWLNAFEMGDKPSAPLDMVMRVADALGVSLLLTRPVRRAPGNLPEPLTSTYLLDRFDVTYPDLRRVLYVVMVERGHR